MRNSFLVHFFPVYGGANIVLGYTWLAMFHDFKDCHFRWDGPTLKVSFGVHCGVGVW